MRLARQPDGQVVCDPDRRRPGRGAYVCDDGECAEALKNTGPLARAFRAPVTVQPKTLDWVREWRRSESTR